MRTVNFSSIAAVALLLVTVGRAQSANTEPEPTSIHRVVAVTNVCAWPNLTLMPDGTIVAVLHNEPSHGQSEGDIDCWASLDGVSWSKRSTITAHAPNTVRMNAAAGLAANGDLIVLCSGWTNEKHPDRPKQARFRDNILSAWVLRSKDGGRTWTKHESFPSTGGNWSALIPFGDIWPDEDGILHTSCYQGEWRAPSQSTKTKSWRSWHLHSADHGHTWVLGKIIGARHNETDIFPLGNGRILAAARAEKMELIRSNDGGLTWLKPVPVTGRNEINGHLARLKDGRLLLSYGVRVNGRRGVCAKLSSDEGLNWGEALRLAHTADGGDCGYPSSVQRADGKIVTAWYSSDSPGHAGYQMGVSIWTAP